jgi:hypothetical protein
MEPQLYETVLIEGVLHCKKYDTDNTVTEEPAEPLTPTE